MQQPPGTSPFPGAARVQGAVAIVEVVVDSHRVMGELRYTGLPRRLVDVLNAADGPFILLYDGELEDLSRPQPRQCRFPLIHVRREAILFVIPRAEPALPPSPREVVQRVPVPATVVLPGFEIVGQVYVPPDADPSRTNFLASRLFVPVTDAVITSCHNHELVWREPLVVVSLARAQVYAAGCPRD